MNLEFRRKVCEECREHGKYEDKKIKNVVRKCEELYTLIRPPAELPLAQHPHELYSFCKYRL